MGDQILSDIIGQAEAQAKADAARHVAKLAAGVKVQAGAVHALVKGQEVFGAKTLLDVLHPLWVALGHGQHGREIYRDIRAAALEVIASNESVMSVSRRGSGLHNSCLAENARLMVLVKEC